MEEFFHRFASRGFASVSWAFLFYVVRIVLVELMVFTVYCLYCNVSGLVVLLLNKFDVI